ncbi:hypothetical protein HC928_25870 [bacterium]|nr:hypothetical protein [bacterium]
MSRMENRAVMGFFAIEPRHHAAILSLVAPATSAHRLLDPFAGEGEFLEAAAQAWNVTPYANELDVPVPKMRPAVWSQTGGTL